MFQNKHLIVSRYSILFGNILSSNAHVVLIEGAGESIVYHRILRENYLLMKLNSNVTQFECSLPEKDVLIHCNTIEVILFSTLCNHARMSGNTACSHVGDRDCQLIV